MNIKEINMQLLKVCIAEVVDYQLAEKLLKQGAKPLGAVEYDGSENNVYCEIVEQLFENDCTSEDFYKITELFLRYGMDISKPAIPYDDDNILHPLWMFAFPSNDCVLRTLKLLLDNGLSADDAAWCWMHAVTDFLHVSGDLSYPCSYEFFYDYIRKLMLIASYPHVLEADKSLQKEIWLNYNHYDLHKFRQWNDYEYIIDTSYCELHPEVYKSVVNIIEKKTGKIVWIFGVGLDHDEIADSDNSTPIGNISPLTDSSNLQ